MKIAFVFEKLTLFKILLSFFLKILFIKVIYYKKSDFLNKILFNFIINKLNLIKVDLSQEMKNFNPNVIDGDVCGYKEKNAQTYIKEKKDFNIFNKFIKNINFLEEKIFLYACQYYSRHYLQHMKIASYLVNSPYSNFLFFVNIENSNNLNFFKFHNLNCKNINFLNLNYFFKILIKIIKQFKISLKSNNITKEKISENYLDYEIIFFPHNSIFSGNLIWNHYYSNKPESPFYPSKIAHFEYDQRANPILNKKKTENLLDLKNIHYRKIQTVMNIKLCLVIFFQFFKLSLFNYNKLKHIFLFVHLYNDFNRYFVFLKKYSNAKIALFNYTELVPIPLSMALESLGIKSIGLQDRIRFSYLREYYYYVDTFFTASIDSTLSLRKKFSNQIINHMKPIGMIRSDFYSNLKKPNKKFIKNNYSFNILYLDFDFNSSIAMDQPILNLNNILFLKKELIYFAKKFPNINFIMRAKNNTWVNNVNFKEIYSEIKSIKNIEIDMDFKDTLRTYKLSKLVDLVISVPSSIVEENLSASINTTVLDYGVNYKNVESPLFNHSNSGFYCKNKNEIINEINKIINGELPNKNFDNLDIDYYLTKADGNVKIRLHHELKKIY